MTMHKTYTCDEANCGNSVSWFDVTGVTAKGETVPPDESDNHRCRHCREKAEEAKREKPKA